MLLSCSAHRLEHRWSKVTQVPRKAKPGLTFGSSYHRPFKGLEDLFFMDESMALVGVNRRSLGLDWIGLEERGVGVDTK